MSEVEENKGLPPSISEKFEEEAKKGPSAPIEKKVMKLPPMV
jgi:hypothetical protein